MKKILCGAALLIVVGVVGFYVTSQSSTNRRFDSEIWKKERQKSTGRNACPLMVDDLMVNELRVGMLLQEVTNMLGHPEVRTQMRTMQATAVHGAWNENIVYTYSPGPHHGWLVTGRQPLKFYFREGGAQLERWSPLTVAINAMGPSASSGASNSRTIGKLPIGDLTIANSTIQFEALLGFPDNVETNVHLTYFLGKRRGFALDDVYFELYFDADHRLERWTCTEH